MSKRSSTRHAGLDKINVTVSLYLFNMEMRRSGGTYLAGGCSVLPGEHGPERTLGTGHQ